MKVLPLVFATAMLASPGLGQTNTPDMQVQRQILEELRAIHREMRASSTLQLLLAQLQITQTSLERANQNRDSSKVQLTQSQADKAAAQGELARFEDGMSKVANPEQEFVDRLNELRTQLQKATAQEKAASEHLEDAENRMRTAQSERDNVQVQLGDLVKKLSSYN